MTASDTEVQALVCKGVLHFRPESLSAADNPFRYPVLTAKRQEGLSLQVIADYLNGEGYVTRRGKRWNAVQVMHVLNRAERLQVN